MRKLVSVLAVAMFIGGCTISYDLGRSKIVKKEALDNGDCLFYTYNSISLVDPRIIAPCDCFDVGDIPMDKWGIRKISKVEAEAQDTLGK